MAAGPPIRPSPLIISPSSPSTTAPATVIFLHGYNDIASTFNCHPPDALSVAYHIHKAPALQHIKIIIPEALPCNWSKVPNNVWYDIPTPYPKSGDPKKAAELVESGGLGSNEDDMKVTLDYFESLIEAEMAMGVPAKRIIFFGYSQGGAIAVLFLLTRRLAANLGGIITCCGFPAVPIPSVIKMQRENGLIQPWSKETRLYVLHGKKDFFVPMEVFRVWIARLEEFKERGHGIATVESIIVDGMGHALRDVLWPHVREILERTVPLTDQRSFLKL